MRVYSLMARWALLVVCLTHPAWAEPPVDEAPAVEDEAEAEADTPAEAPAETDAPAANEAPASDEAPAEDDPAADAPADKAPDEASADKAPAEDEATAEAPADDDTAEKPAEGAKEKPDAAEADKEDDESADDSAEKTDVAQDDDDGDVDDGDDDEAAVAQPAKRKQKKKTTGDPLTAFRQREYAKARDGYLNQVSDRPDAPALHYRVAVSAALAQDPSTAERHAATTERLDPGNLVAIELAAAARVLRVKANPPTIALAQAQRALQDGRLRSAVRLATTALTKEEADQGALHRVRGMALLGLGRGDEASAALRSAAAFGHHDAALWLALGDSARIVGDKSQAAYFYTLTADGAAAGDPIQAVARARRARLGKTTGKKRKR